MQVDKVSRIPEIDDTRLQDLLKTIKPVVRFFEDESEESTDEGALYYIAPVHPRKTAYTWDPQARERAPEFKTLRDVTTYHTWGYYGFFKPSIAEVIAQIPADLHDSVVAFEIIDYPRSTDDLNKHLDILNEGYHVATTRLYSLA